MNHMIPMDDDAFVRVPDQSGLILLCFTSTFCGPSRVLINTLTEFMLDRRDYPLTLVQVDVEKLPLTTKRYQVKGTPQLIMLRDGEPVSSRLGTMGFEDLSDYIDSELEAA
jgi:thioredoxin-like negative regulator of GroEL